MRTALVIELAKEVLGPRNGANEVISDNPLTEYITGVLAPAANKNVQMIEDEQEIPSDISETYEGEETDVDIQTPVSLHPTLDPKSRPSSMGISFTIKAKKSDKVRICLTWARYFTIEEETNKGDKEDEDNCAPRQWQRKPYITIFDFPLKTEKKYFNEDGIETNKIEEAILSFNGMINWTDEKCTLDLFIENIMKAAPKCQNIDKHIFQSQIRVKCPSDVSLVEGIKSTPKRLEEQELEFLYRERPVFARGHLCSAVWKEIDPENDEKVDPKYLQTISKNEPLFHWVDGTIASSKDRLDFSPPDVRTEFMPMYSIPFPRLDWPKEFGESPELRAHILAQLCNPSDLRKALSPFLAGYEKWISQKEVIVKTLPSEQRTLAEGLIIKCRQVHKRMAKGLDLLAKDEEARLSFCFANKAIDTQNSWSSNNEFVWYPFQLAFILMSIESILNKDSSERSNCDALWVSTGAGKTEAYLALVAIVSAYRRRHALRNITYDLTGSGVSVITRYTLRLLTIQQFRRALALIAACELLRVDNLPKKSRVGWRPDQISSNSNYIWGSTPFSIGLWVGGAVSPNSLQPKWATDHSIPGALDILKGQLGEGEPAQILTCPACKSILAVPDRGLQPGEHEFHFVVRTPSEDILRKDYDKQIHDVSILSTSIFKHDCPSYYTYSVRVNSKTPLKSKDVDDLWFHIHDSLSKNAGSIELVPARASRLGYFLRYYLSKTKKEYDFEVFCPKPDCPLHKPWCGGAPFGWVNGKDASNHSPTPDGVKIPLFFDGNRLIDVQEPFQFSHSQNISDRIPLTCMTVEEQVFSRLPTLLVATVDKFARPPFKPSASSIFGNVDFHHCIYGYYRQHEIPSGLDNAGHPVPAGTPNHHNYIRLPHALESPNLIIQDELHLIEGPLGSLVGIYETAIDFLCNEIGNKPIKYIASTATIRRAEEQIKAVFLRQLQLFPPHGLSASDRFFISDQEVHPAESSLRGRLYVGICAPGRGPMTPLRNIYAKLLQTVDTLKSDPDIDNFWTLTGYFNAVRELAGARALYRQDIPQRVAKLSSGGDFRLLDDENAMELSSRTPSTDLPAILDVLARPVPNAADCLFATSMFGTGVDISRIGLMVVNGQPKTTSTYIQSTGRVGRRKGALVVTFLRASRPRDLSHYEFFTGYHRQLHRYVEPVTTNPFAPGVLERTIGPICVFLLRNMHNTTVQWHLWNTASSMSTNRSNVPEIAKTMAVIASRAAGQHRTSGTQNIAYNELKKVVERKLDQWQSVAANNPTLRYVEYAIGQPPTFPVVLGDYQHQHARLAVVYENAPNSLRDIEETTGFQT